MSDISDLARQVAAAAAATLGVVVVVVAPALTTFGRRLRARLVDRVYLVVLPAAVLVVCAVLAAELATRARPAVVVTGAILLAVITGMTVWLVRAVRRDAKPPAPRRRPVVATRPL